MTNEPLKKVRCKICHDEFLLVELKYGVCLDCELTKRKKEKCNERSAENKNLNRKG